MTYSLWAVAAAAGIALASSAAQADVPAASYITEAGGGEGLKLITTPGTVSSSGTNANGFASGTATATGGQYVYGNVAGSGEGNEGFANPSATYYFTVLGPDSAAVPLLISGTAFLTATGQGSIEGLETPTINGNLYNGFHSTCYVGSGGCGAFNFSQSLTLHASTDGSGDIGAVTLKVYAVGFNGTASGYVDPSITVDPSFANAGAYHVVFSEGVTNGGVAPVPEPAEMAMLGAGLGIVGGVAKRRRRA